VPWINPKFRKQGKMRHKWIEEPTEAEISLEDTQEYRVDDDGFIIEPDDDDAVVEEDLEYENEGFAEYETGEVEIFDDEESYEDDDPLEDVPSGVDEAADAESVSEVEPEKVDRVAIARERAAQAGEKVRAGWAAAVARARKVELPERPEKIDSTLALSIAAIALLSLIIGVGAFFVGKGSGDSVDQAGLEGRAAGASAGAIKGASGYGTAFKVAREKAFEKAYVPAYRKNFKRVYEDEGLPVPPAKEIQVPEP